ncbi:hypothetical protein [Parerythrobacter lacustris]|uniref:Uncharacterized protein n=1 Tax=Parerythrobacter lacustris TaxID=2969984 RepID=A0ABT1XP08_9SPHN|nr:hypothetical protein [Parerythrobacter lacustris]MCR2833394.1 hypothetical protein [Parerythrobacter lacustris]
MFTQLQTPMPLHVLGRGNGLAIAVIDYGPEHNLIWVTAIDATGEIWCAPNPEVRMQKNWTLGRGESLAVKASKRELAG